MTFRLGVVAEKAAAQWFRDNDYPFMRASIVELWADPAPESQTYWDSRQRQYPWLEEGKIKELRKDYRLRKEEATTEVKRFFGDDSSRLEEMLGLMKEATERRASLNEAYYKEFWESEERYRVNHPEYWKDRREWSAHLGTSMKNLPRGSHHTSMVPDFLVKMPAFTFVEVKANDAKVERRQRLFFDLAQKHGFSTKILRVEVTTDDVTENSAPVSLNGRVTVCDHQPHQQ